MTSLGRERRNHIRRSLHTPIRIQRPGLVDSLETMTRNIGERGIGFSTTCFFAKELPLKIEFPSISAGSPCLVNAKVAWTQKLPHSDMYRIGVEFIDGSELVLDHVDQLYERQVADSPVVQQTPYELSV